VTEALVAILVVAGGAFCAIAGLGLWRLPDVLIRMHASSKAGTLGCGLVLAAVALASGEVSVVSRAGLAILFVAITAPVASHLIGRAAYRSGTPLDPRMVVDELARDRRAEAGRAGEPGGGP
jgi:multicomponent Na+:H+ antiporter subunit G